MDHLRLMRLRLTLVGAALVVAAPTAHAFTMNSMTDPGGGTKYVDPDVPLSDAAKGKTTTEPDFGGLQFNVGPTDRFGFGSGPGAFRGSTSSNRNLWAPPDQSRFNDR
jgi:hypothetical protein